MKLHDTGAVEISVPEPSKGPSKIYGLMIKVMADVEPIAKDKRADKFNFRGIDDVYAALQAILAKHGVFTTSKILSEQGGERVSKSGGVIIHRLIKVRYMFWADDGSMVPTEVLGEGMDSSDKSANKAMSVAHKYAFLQAFSIPTREPKDPEDDQHKLATEEDQRAIKEAEEKAKVPAMRSRSGKIMNWTEPELKALVEAAKGRAEKFQRGVPEHKDLFGRLWKLGDYSWDAKSMIKAAESLEKRSAPVADLEVEIEAFHLDQKEADAARTPTGG